MTIVLSTHHVRRSAQAVPLAAGCLAASLPESLRSTTRLVDSYPEQNDRQILDAILAHNPNVVAFPLYAWNRVRLQNLALRLKETKPDIRLVAGGPEATADTPGILGGGGFDAVVRGEGEIPFRHLMLHWQAGGPQPEIEGVVFKDAASSSSVPSQGMETLDSQPSPWLEGVLVPEEGQGVLWEISRGCPFGCDFCFDARGNRGVRHVPMPRLEAELDLFVRKNVSQIWILDSTFNYPPERGKALLRLLTKKAPHIHFHLEAKADFLDRETARLLAKLSCSVQIGLQSARPKVLRHVHRSLDLDLFNKKIRLLSAEGVTFGLDLIYGLPTDDFSGFANSLNTALGFGPNHLDIFPLALLPGTPLYRNRKTLDIRAQESPPYEVLSTKTLDAQGVERCRTLAAATDLFYNVGRAVGFFQGLLKATAEDAATFLEGFAEWGLRAKNISRPLFLDASRWSPAQVLELQEGYIRHRFKSLKRQDLLPAALDMMRYHFHYAETLLGEETLAAAESARIKDPWNTPWRPAPTIRLVPFAYEILDLVEMGETDLERFASLFRPVGSAALFARRGPEVLCESLEEGFLKLLQGSDGAKTPREIFSGSIARREGEEILEFAVSEGLLIPAAGSAI